MCGRYVLNPTPDFPKSFHLDPQIPLFDIKPSFNIAPGTIEPVVVKNSPNHLELMCWGLGTLKIINARSESLLEKYSFRKPFKSGRCLVPASGFFEWQGEGKAKTPYYITVKDSPLFAMAGLYENNTYTIITTEANEFMSTIHTRMPAILHPKDYDHWLDNSVFDQDKLTSLLIPYSGLMHSHPVSSAVNSPANQSESLIYPVNTIQNP